MTEIIHPSPMLLAAVLSSAADRYAESGTLSLVTAVHQSAVHLAPHCPVQTHVDAMTIVADHLGQRPEQWVGSPADVVAVLWCCEDRLRYGGAS